nr:MAG TPA: hypothetical protein [Caudoviricetes sp.]
MALIIFAPALVLGAREPHQCRSLMSKSNF